MTDTWFKLPGQETVVSTTRGTRPGDCLADILFSYVFSDVLAKVKDAVEACGLCHQLPWCKDMHGSVRQLTPTTPEQMLSMHESTWMDDLCVVAALPSADRLLTAFRSIAGCLLDVCLSKGMMPNLKSNKTEVLLSVSGAGARCIRRDLLSEQEPSLGTLSGSWPAERVRVVAKYKHLGGIIHHRAGLEPEARCRAGQAWTAFQKHKRTVFGHPLVAVADKAALFCSLVLSTLLYGCGAWCNVQPTALAIVSRAYINMARVMLARHFRGDVRHLCDDRVLALMQLPSLGVWMHFHRLSYLASFVAVDEPVAWALAHAEGSWLADVRDSLEWLWRQIDGGSRHSSWEVAWEAWHVDIRQSPGKWKRLIRFARESALRKEIILEGWQQCRGLLLKRLMRAGAVLTAFADDFHDGVCACGPCQRLFRCKQAWAVHAFRTHGRVKASRRLVEGSQCPICLKQYATNVQLCSHIDHSSFCRSRLVSRGFACSPQPGRGSRKAAFGADFLGSVRQGFGPILECSAPEGRVALMRHYSPAIWRALLALLQPSSVTRTFQDLLEGYRCAFCVDCCSPEVLIRCAQEWRQFIREAPPEELTVVQSAWHSEVSAWVCNNISVQWLVPGHEQPAEHNYTFRQSVAGLAALELDPIAPGDGDGIVCTSLVTVGLSSVLPAFQADGYPVVASFVFEDCCQDPAWCDRLWDCLRGRENCLVVICLSGVRFLDARPCGPLKARQLRALHGPTTVLQHVLLLVVEFWLQRLPFVAVLPSADDAISALVKRLPKLCWSQGPRLSIPHNVPSSVIPKSCFTFN